MNNSIQIQPLVIFPSFLARRARHSRGRSNNVSVDSLKRTENKPDLEDSSRILTYFSTSNISDMKICAGASLKVEPQQI